ncbi:MAG: DUF2294 domain-containing protein [Solirubrobacterales bacterium]
MPKKNKLESDIASQIVRYQRELVGKGPADARAYVIEDMIIVRMKGSLTTEEKHLARTERGRQVVKQMRQVLRENYATDLEAIIAELTGCSVVSSHADISTKSGERFEIFILDRDLEQTMRRE